MHWPRCRAALARAWPADSRSNTRSTSSLTSFTRSGAAMTDIFIVGPARAGTSWLQTMLAEHPDIGSPSETGLFVEFLGPPEHAWQQHRGQLHTAIEHGDSMNVQGLATVVTDDDML